MNLILTIAGALAATLVFSFLIIVILEAVCWIVARVASWFR